jgi:hypothetical protein
MEVPHTPTAQTVFDSKDELARPPLREVAQLPFNPAAYLYGSSELVLSDEEQSEEGFRLHDERTPKYRDDKSTSSSRELPSAPRTVALGSGSSSSKRSPLSSSPPKLALGSGSSSKRSPLSSSPPKLAKSKQQTPPQPPSSPSPSSILKSKQQPQTSPSSASKRVSFNSSIEWFEAMTPGKPSPSRDGASSRTGGTSKHHHRPDARTVALNEIARTYTCDAALLVCLALRY